MSAASSHRVPRDAVLLTIDIQQGFPPPPARNNPDLEANLARLHAAWRKAGRPLWFVRHDSTEPGSVLRPGQSGNDFVPATAPKPGEPVIAKSVHSAFIGTDLEERLQRAGCESLVIAGIQTNLCVATTARMAGNLGYTTFVIGDACATYSKRLLDGRVVDAQTVHDLALADLDGEFAKVLTTADAIAAL